MAYQIFHNNDRELNNFFNTIKFWSNSGGELHHHGEYDISEDELPEPLQRAYKELWNDGICGLNYLVETPKGYGIALINEYDTYTSSTYDCPMDDLFLMAMKDGLNISIHPEFSLADVYIGEYSGCGNCHELVVVFPADIPKEEFDKAAATLDSLAYKSVLERYETVGIKSRIDNAIESLREIVCTVEFNPSLKNKIHPSVINGITTAQLVLVDALEGLNQQNNQKDQPIAKSSIDAQIRSAEMKTARPDQSGKELEPVMR